MSKITKITTIKPLSEEEEKRLQMSKCTLEERIRILGKVKGNASPEKQATSSMGKTKTLAELIKPISDSTDISDTI